MPCRAPSASAAPRRAHALGHHPHAAENFVQRTAAAELDPDLAVAAQIPGAGQHQVAEAAQAGERVAPPAFGNRQPRHLRQPARDQRRERVVAEPKPFDTAGRDRDDVLQRAADLDAGDVVVDVEPEAAAAEVLLHRLGGRGVGRRREHRGRQPAGHFEREARPRQHDDADSSRRSRPRSPATSAAASRLRCPSWRSPGSHPARDAARRAPPPRGSRATAPRRRRSARRSARSRATAVADTPSGIGTPGR